MLHNRKSGLVDVFAFHTLKHSKIIVLLGADFKLRHYHQVVLLDEYSFVDAPVFEMDYMIHEFSAAGSASLESIQDGAGRLQIEYRIFSFPGQGDPDRIDVVVPVLARGLKSERWARRPARL